MSSLDEFAKAKLAALSNSRLARRIHETRRGPDSRAERAGADLISFCCNDYLDLTQHRKVKKAAIAATRKYGAGAGASRLVTGSHPLYACLEEQLARIKGTEAAVVFGSGFLANLGIVPALAGTGDLILADELVHASLHAGANAASARSMLFAHNDAEDCARLLAAHRGEHARCLILTEGVFSMDGDRAPLTALAEIAREYDGWLLVDDAHGFGVLGGGRGSAFEDGDLDIPLQMGTLSKAVGAYGGFLCASKPVIELMASRARSLIYTTGLPPGVVGAAIAALDIIEHDSERVAAPLRNARRFTASLNLPAAESPIVPVIVGDSGRALDAAAALAERGFLVSAIRPPTVPDGTARLRFTFTAGHRDRDIERLVAAVREIGLAA
jgi:8-amino-7-oxononanoate synthase